MNDTGTFARVMPWDIDLVNVEGYTLYTNKIIDRALIYTIWNPKSLSNLISSDAILYRAETYIFSMVRLPLIRVRYIRSHNI
jgi:hypothetical protein